MRHGYLRQNANVVGAMVKLTDIFIVLICFLVAHFLRYGHLELSSQNLLLVVSSMFLTHIALSASGTYGRWRGKSLTLEIQVIALAMLFVVMSLASLAYIFKSGASYSRIYVAIAFSITLLGLSCSRAVIRLIANWRRSNGYNYRTVLIIGAGSLGQRVASTLEKQTWTGMRVIGFLDDNSNMKSNNLHGIPYLGNCLDAAKVVEEYRSKNRSIDHVWIALPSRSAKKVESIIEELLDSTASVSIVPDFFELNLHKASIDNIANIPVISLSENRIHGVNSVIKSIMDFSLALILLVLCAPLFLLIAILIKLDSAGPVFFIQRRYGIDGKEITVWKFRTMNVLDDGGVVIQAKKNDPRVTKLGSFLRKTSIDELPQLFNVLLGTMSLVGPRPHAIAHNEEYRRKIRGYMSRHRIKPGITGLAQVSGFRGETDTDHKMIKRIEFDLSYIKTWSLLLDIKILVLTLKQVFFAKNVY